MVHPKQPTDIDKFVGARVRQARREDGLTQEQLGNEVGLTFQQIQKYEKGVNRISAGRLVAFADALHRPITYFYPTSTNISSVESAKAIALEVRDLRKEIRDSLREVSDVKDLRAIARVVSLATH